MIIALFKCGRNRRERGVQRRAERLHGGDDRYRDASSNEAIFDGRSAGLILAKLTKQLNHGSSPFAISVVAGQHGNSAFLGIRETTCGNFI